MGYTHYEVILPLRQGKAGLNHLDLPKAVQIGPSLKNFQCNQKANRGYLHQRSKAVKGSFELLPALDKKEITL